MTTFEARVEHRLRDCRDADLVDHLLDAMPYIKEYYGADDSTPPDDSTVRPTSRPASRWEIERKGRSVTMKPRNKKMDSFINVESHSTQNRTLQRYMFHVENNYDFYDVVRDRDYNPYACKCGGRCEYEPASAHLVCCECGTVTPYQIDSHASLPFEENPGYSLHSPFAYKRLNHFTEWINSLQALENTEIPLDVLDAVRAEFKKRRISSSDQITPGLVHETLKRLRLNRWYENKNAICQRLGGTPAPRLGPALEDKLKHMFLQIQGPFEKHRPAWRKNFLSYAYCLHKMVQLLGHDELLPYFPLLKSKDKLFQMDTIFRKICADLGWQFIRST